MRWTAAALPAAKSAAARKRRHERALHQRSDVGPASRRGDGAALSLSPALVLDAAGGARLLAGRAALRVGISATLHRPEFGFLRARQRRLYRGRADVGCAVSRPARLLDLVSGR